MTTSNTKTICFIIVSLLSMLPAFLDDAFAEGETDYHVSIGANYDNYETINVGFFGQYFAGINGHADLTLIHSPKLNYVPGIDVGVGLAFFRVGAVLGGYRDQSTHSVKAIGAIYPELYLPMGFLLPESLNKKITSCEICTRFVPYLNARYYITSKSSNFGTLGIGVVWYPSR